MAALQAQVRKRFLQRVFHLSESQFSYRPISCEILCAYEEEFSHNAHALGFSILANILASQKKPGSLSTPARNTYNHAFHQYAVLYSRLPTLLCSKFNVQSGREEEVDESMFENEFITIDEVNVLHEELVRGFG